MDWGQEKKSKLDAYMELLGGVGGLYDERADISAQETVDQPFRKEGQGVWDLVSGSGASPAQRRANLATWGAVLNRGNGESAMGALAQGSEKGMQLMDNIRGRKKEEALGANAAKIDAEQARMEAAAKQYSLASGEEGLVYDREQDAYDKTRDTADDLYRKQRLEQRDTQRGQDISAATTKMYNERLTEQREAHNNAIKYQGLAEQFAQADYTGGGGVPTAIVETMKELVGNEDRQSMLINSGRSVIVSNAIKNLPPGVASDKDMELVMSPEPGKFANPKYMAKYLQARARLEKKAAEYQDFVLTYMDNNGVKGNNIVGVNSAWKLHSVPAHHKQRVLDNINDPKVQEEFITFYSKGGQNGRALLQRVIEEGQAQ